MKQLSISLFFLASLLILVFQQSEVYTNATQPNTGLTGAPGEGTCATVGCHNTTTTEVSPTQKFIELQEFGGSSLSSGYSGNEGSTLNLQLGFNQTLASAARYGFSMTVLFEDGTPAGTLAKGNGANGDRESLSTANGKQYIGHKSADSNPNWLFQYTLPSSITQDIIFYIAANGADGDGIADSDGSDKIYLAEYRLSSGDFGVNEGPVSVQNISNITNINVFPNPVQSSLNLSFNLDKGGYTKAEIIDIKGSSVNTLFTENLNPGNYNRQFTLNQNLNSGIYLVRIQMEGKTYFQKIMVQ